MNEWLAGLARMIIVAIVTTVFIVGGLTLVYGQQTRDERQTFLEIRNGTLATVCVLALPVDPDVGRDPVKVTECLDRYGLEP